MIEAPYIMGVRARDYYEKRIQQVDAEMDKAQLQGTDGGWMTEVIGGLSIAAEAERSDPEPTVGPFCRCESCLVYYMQVSE